MRIHGVAESSTIPAVEVLEIVPANVVSLSVCLSVCRYNPNQCAYIRLDVS